MTWRCAGAHRTMEEHDFGYLRVIMYIVHISALCGANIRAEVMCAGWLQEDLTERVFSGERMNYLRQVKRAVCCRCPSRRHAKLF